eukprot:361040-Chlamydomonas_euryale.AAC.5
MHTPTRTGHAHPHTYRTCTPPHVQDAHLCALDFDRDCACARARRAQPRAHLPGQVCQQPVGVAVAAAPHAIVALGADRAPRTGRRRHHAPLVHTVRIAPHLRARLGAERAAQRLA